MSPVVEKHYFEYPYGLGYAGGRCPSLDDHYRFSDWSNPMVKALKLASGVACIFALLIGVMWGKESSPP